MYVDFFNRWLQEVNKQRGKSGNCGSKLRTYRLFKNDYATELYCSKTLSRKHRSAFAKFRCGVAPLRIETGRYENLSVENRTCFFFL